MKDFLKPRNQEPQNQATKKSFLFSSKGIPSTPAPDGGRPVAFQGGPYQIHQGKLWLPKGHSGTWCHGLGGKSPACMNLTTTDNKRLPIREIQRERRSNLYWRREMDTKLHISKTSKMLNWQRGWFPPIFVYLAWSVMGPVSQVSATPGYYPLLPIRVFRSFQSVVAAFLKIRKEFRLRGLSSIYCGAMS